jgi:zinc protease
MHKKIISIAGVLLILVSRASTQQIDVAEHMLKNGMKVLLIEDHTVPSICMSVGYHVGSRNERPGITGISHLFEHMMFNGSAKYAPTEFDKILESGGGYSNAFTANDITFYYEEFNSGILDKTLDLESDRIRSLKLDTANIEQERGIVKEERRLRTDNSPQSKMIEDLYAAAYVAHPYKNPVVGWMGDLDNISLQDAKDYFRIYYAPNNATMIVTGDFKKDELIKKIEQFFGDIPAHEKPRPVNDAEPEQEGERRIELYKVAQLSSVAIGYKGASVSSKDYFALDVLGSVLARGESSRLYSVLVYDKQIATSISASQDEFIDRGLFTIVGQASPGHTAAEIEKEVYAILDSVRLNGITDTELQKAKNAVQADFVRRFKTNSGIASVLGYTDIVHGDYTKAFRTIDVYNAVTKEDVQRVAEQYLTDRKRTVVTLVPDAPPERPEH